MSNPRLAVVSVLLALALPVSAAREQTETGPSDASPILQRTLDRLAGVARLYKDNALRFTCDESVLFSGRGAPVHRRFRYVYRYSNGVLLDYRTERGAEPAEAGLETDFAEYGIPVVLLRAYSWVFLFEKGTRDAYRFAYAGEDTVLDRPAHIIGFEPIPPHDEARTAWSGKAWVDQESSQLLLVEAMRPQDRHQQQLLDAEVARTPEPTDPAERGTFTITRYSTVFDVVKNGMRFPGEVVIERIDHVVGDAPDEGRIRSEPVFRMAQTYKGYRFFAVRSAAEIREIVGGGD